MALCSKVGGSVTSCPSPVAVAVNELTRGALPLPLTVAVLSLKATR